MARVGHPGGRAGQVKSRLLMVLVSLILLSGTAAGQVGGPGWGVSYEVRPDRNPDGVINTLTVRRIVESERQTPSGTRSLWRTYYAYTHFCGGPPSDAPGACWGIGALPRNCAPGEALVHLDRVRVNRQTGERQVTYLGTRCLGPREYAPIPISLFDELIGRAMDRMGVPAPPIHMAPQRGIISIESYFWTEPPASPPTLLTEEQGWRLESRLTPASYSWHFGDGEVEVSDKSGGRYDPSAAHIFWRRSDRLFPDTKAYTVRLDVLWTVEMRTQEPGRPWSDWVVLEEQVSSSSTALHPVDEVVTRLVGK